MAFTKILVANRGEIACRIMRSARKLGYRTVAVYSAADAAAPHVAEADEAVLLGPAPVSESYLAIDKVLAAAARTGAGAIHPGYGLLSENADFARACADAGVVFIGPPAEAIELMGNKRRAKLAMEAAGVPCVPGYNGADQADETLLAEGRRIGFPLMVKAAAGGGGRGMRLVSEPEGLPEALRSARAEAASAFGSGELIVEKAVVRPRHVEVQIFGDSQGHVIHLGERDCSVQRRHQKVIEESPSPAVDQPLRDRMGQAAVEAARACGYVGAGTVELLLAEDQSFYFLEMNTRLQVEHPVTELVTGVDLVEWQLRVAAGEPLPLSQEQIRMHGHAIEARLYAEDPSHGFMPQTGQVLVWQAAAGADVRVDHGLASGQVISSHYDPMLGKVIAHGQSRDEARRKLAAALRHTTLLGVLNNKAFLAAICEHPVFAAGGATTAFLGSEFAEHGTVTASAAPRSGFAVAALLVYLEAAGDLLEDPSFIGWRSGGPLWSTIVLRHEETELEMLLSSHGSGAHGRRYQVRVVEDDGQPGEPVELEVARHDGTLDVVCEGVLQPVRYARRRDEVWTDDGLAVRCYLDVTQRPAQSAEGAGSGRLSAPLDGRVTEVFVEVGQRVARGDLLMVIEAMKMEHRIESDVGGGVAALHVASGEQVKTRQLLAEIAPGDPADSGADDAKEGE